MKKVFVIRGFLIMAFVAMLAGYAYSAINRCWQIKAGGTGDRTEGQSWADGVAICWDTAAVATWTAGDVFFVMDGAHSISAAIDKSASDGTATAPISIIGVKSTCTDTGLNVVYADWSVDTTMQHWMLDTSDIPFVDQVTYQIKTGDFTNVYGIRAQGDALGLFSTGASCNVRNCIFEEDASSSSIRKGLTVGNYSTVMGCLFTSANAGGLSLGAGCRVKFCTFNDITDATNGVGVLVGGNSCSVLNCIFDDVKNTAISVISTDYGDFSCNTFYDCATDAGMTDGIGNIFIGNVHDSTETDAYKSTTQTDINIFWGNHGDDTRCTDMYDGVSNGFYQDYRVTTGDPKFTSTTDFNLLISSPCLNTGPGPYPKVK